MSILFIVVKRQECSSAGRGRQLINLLCCNALSRLPKQPLRECAVSVCVFVYLYLVQKCAAAQHCQSGNGIVGALERELQEESHKTHTATISLC